MHNTLNPLIKIGTLVIFFRAISIFIYYFDSTIVSTPAHLVPMALFTHLSGILGFMLLLLVIPQTSVTKPVIGLIAVVVFSLFTLLGEIHFNLERLSGQPLHWNIFTTYLGSGFIGNMDVLGPLYDSIGLVSLSVFFFLFTLYYSFRKYIEFLNNYVPYRNSTHYVGGITALFVVLSIYGPGSKHHAIFVVQPPEWNLIEDLLASEMIYTPEEEQELIKGLRRLIISDEQTNWVNDQYPLLRRSPIKQTAGLSKKPDIFLLVVESLRGEELQAILNQDESLNPYKNLKVLANRGIYYQNYNSNGYPTVSGIFSMHTSTVPHLYQNNITKAQAVTFDGFSSRIKKQDYYSVALWGGNPGHVNELKWARRWFNDFDFIVPGDYLKQSVNRSDAEVYKKLIEKIKKHDALGLDKPFYGYIFTGMTHKPFRVEHAYFSSEAQKQESLKYAKRASNVEERYRSALTVLDLQIGKLLAYLDTRNKKDNTLIFLVGDHSMNAQNAISPKFAGFPVDDLVWTGAIIAGPKSILGGNIPRIETFPSSHSDLLPTIVNIFEDNQPYSAFGNDLLSAIPSSQRSSIAIGPKGVRIDSGLNTLYFSKKYDDNFWLVPRKIGRGNLLMDKNNQQDYTREQVDEFRRSLNYWSSLVDQNRVWVE